MHRNVIWGFARNSPGIYSPCVKIQPLHITNMCSVCLPVLGGTNASWIRTKFLWRIGSHPKGASSMIRVCVFVCMLVLLSGWLLGLLHTRPSAPYTYKLVQYEARMTNLVQAVENGRLVMDEGVCVFLCSKSFVRKVPRVFGIGWVCYLNCIWSCEWMRALGWCMCVCARARVCIYVYICVCVRAHVFIQNTLLHLSAKRYAYVRIYSSLFSPQSPARVSLHFALFILSQVKRLWKLWCLFQDYRSFTWDSVSQINNQLIMHRTLISTPRHIHAHWSHH